jgi:hypothetical protein
VNGDNLTLRLADLEVMPAHLKPKTISGRVRAGCPFHGSDRQRSLSLDPDSGRFQCFVCGCWGYTEDARERYKAANAGSRPKTSRPTPKTVPIHRLRVRADGDLHELDESRLEDLDRWQKALPGSAGHAYLTARGIDLSVAQAFGAGYLAPGEAMGRNVDGGLSGWGPRVVFPHSRPDGAVVSLYGRRTDGGDQAKHHHLAGPKGMFNAAAIEQGIGPLWLAESAIDAMSLRVAGVDRVAAIFGLDGVRWEWLEGIREIVLAFDSDAAGQAAIGKLHAEAAARGIQVSRLTIQEMGGKKDVNEALVAGCLRITGLEAQPPGVDLVQAEIQQRVAAMSDDPPGNHLATGWQAFKTAAAGFATLHLRAAIDAGWRIEDLFSLPWNRLGTGGGAVWTFCEMPGQLEVGPDAIVMVNGDSRLAFRRGESVTGALPWRVENTT